MGQSMKPGGGGRFNALRAALAEKGVRDPGGLAASIGMKKYGRSRFQKMAQAGKRRSAGK